MHIAVEITANSTETRRASQSASAKLRDSLTAQLASAQADLSANLIVLRQNGGNADLIAQGEVQLGALLALKSQLERATPSSMVTIRAEIASCVALASKLAQQAQQAQTAAAGGGQNATFNSLVAASQASRASVASFEDDYYKKKIFDPYLRFTSAEDEEKYRREEATRKAEIDKALALHTPQGDLRANTLALDQLKDAGAHGAEQSPEYEAMRRKLETSRNNLFAATTPSQAAEGKNNDIADSVRPAITVPDSVLAALRAVKTADTGGEGHGVPLGKAQGTSVSRGS